MTYPWQTELIIIMKKPFLFLEMIFALRSIPTFFVTVCMVYLFILGLSESGFK